MDNTKEKIVNQKQKNRNNKDIKYKDIIRERELINTQDVQGQAE